MLFDTDLKEELKKYKKYILRYKISEDLLLYIEALGDNDTKLQGAFNISKIKNINIAIYNNNDYEVILQNY